MQQTSLGIVAFLSAIALSGTFVRADEIPPCAAPYGVGVVPVLKKAPAALQLAIFDTMGDLAAPGERFDDGDVYENGRDRRLIFIWNTGRRWIVATEHGGFAYNDPIFVFVLSADNRQASLAETVVRVHYTVFFIPTTLL